VVDGEIPACALVILACKRHLDDLSRSDFSFFFDHESADRVCRFIEKLPHTKGRWAARGLNLRLEDWQTFITCSLFGWRDRSTNRYRFTEAYIEVPRKNGKSPWAAAIGLYKFAADGEFGAEVYSGATTERQALEVFRPARLMARNTPALTSHFGIFVGAKNLAIPENGSRFEPLIGKPGDGAAPSCAIADEYHEHQSDEQVDTMRTGMVGRENPLLLYITTAGTDRSGPCFALHQKVAAMLQGLATHDNLFGIIFTIDDGDDWTSESALRKANPNYGISVDPVKLRNDQRDAVQSARAQNTFKTKHLNVWCNADVSWMNMQKWEALADCNLCIEQFAGEPCIQAFDLASRKDIASRVTVFRRMHDGKPHYYCFASHYLNQAAVEESKGSHYPGWSKEDRIIVTPGNITDYKRIMDDIVTDSARFSIREIPFDEYHANGLVQFIQADQNWNQNVTFVKFPATVGMMSPAMKEVEALVLDGRLRQSRQGPAALRAQAERLARDLKRET